MNKGSLKVQNCIPHPLSGKKNHLLIPEYPMTPAVTLHSEPADAVPVLVDFLPVVVDALPIFMILVNTISVLLDVISVLMDDILYTGKSSPILFLPLLSLLSVGKL